MKGENLVEGESLGKYKINKLQHGKCFAQYFCTPCFCIRKLIRPFSDTSTGKKTSLKIPLDFRSSNTIFPQNSQVGRQLDVSGARRVPLH